MPKKISDGFKRLRSKAGSLEGREETEGTSEGKEPPKYGADPLLPWCWEGNVQAQVARHLAMDGWTIESAANTATRQRGIDLVATKGARRLAMEVKGFPGKVYARGPKVGQPKPTSPNLQAGHWLAGALLTAILIRGSSESLEVALVFPDIARYRGLISRVWYAIERLQLRVFLCHENGEVAELHRGTLPSS